LKKIFTNIEYKKYVEKKSPKSPIIKNILRAFLVGGLICVIGQGIFDIVQMQGIGKELSSDITSVVLIFIGAILTALNVYDEIGKFGGAGAAVPITGFANSIVSPAMEFKKEGNVMGVGAKMFVIAGPVIVFGVTSSIFVGIIYLLMKSI
jgi:stage V sporulation protein AC